MSLSLSEKIVRAYRNGEKMPLKGKTKIVLTDVRTGKEEITESENLITNAVATILANNWNLYGNFSKLLPLKNLFSGVMCFNGTLTENANNFNPPNDNTNQLIAHAGDEPNQTASTLRGSPNAAAYEETDDSITFVWDWPLEAGNDDEINCVCLCPGDLGNMGLKPFDNTLNVVSQFHVQNDVTGGDTLSENTCIKWPISIDVDGKTGKAIWWDGTTFKEVTVIHDWLSFGVVRSATDYTKGTVRSATVRATTARHGFIFADTNYYYCCEITSTTTIQCDRIAKSDFTVTQMDMTFAGTNLYTGQWYGNRNPQFFKTVPPWPYDGTYLYLPNNSLTGFVGVNPNNNADVLEISGTVATLDNYIRENRQTGNFLPVIISPGLIWFNAYLINYNKAYDIARPANLSVSNRPDGCLFATYRKGASAYGMPYKNGIDYTYDAGPFILGMFLSSINNLESAVRKDLNKTMRVSYTITEVAEE